PSHLRMAGDSSSPANTAITSLTKFCAITLVRVMTMTRVVTTINHVQGKGLPIDLGQLCSCYLGDPDRAVSLGAGRTRGRTVTGEPRVATECQPSVQADACSCRFRQ